jgi:hypothetical protein
MDMKEPEDQRKKPDDHDVGKLGVLARDPQCQDKDDKRKPSPAGVVASLPKEAVLSVKPRQLAFGDGLLLVDGQVLHFVWPTR